MKLKKEHWVVIKFQGVDSLVTLDENNNDFRWFGGMSWCSMLPTTTIEKDYEWFVEGDPKIDEIELDYYRNFNAPKVSIEQSGGWLSPDGKFYVCGFYEHDSSAKHLSAIYYNSILGTKLLEENGWIKVGDNGFVFFDYARQLTKKQIDTLVKISLLDGEDKGYSEYFNDSLKDMLVIYDKN